ncbi:hypothetical protein, partial [Pedobacter sp. UBA4863]
DLQQNIGRLDFFLPFLSRKKGVAPAAKSGSKQQNYLMNSQIRFGERNQSLLLVLCSLFLVLCSNQPLKARFLLLTGSRKDATIKVTTNEKTNQPTNQP